MADFASALVAVRVQHGYVRIASAVTLGALDEPVAQGPAPYRDVLAMEARRDDLREMTATSRTFHGSERVIGSPSSSLLQKLNQVPRNPCCSTPGTAQLHTPAGNTASRRCVCCAVRGTR